MLYNDVVLVSAIQQLKSVLIIHMSPPSEASLPSPHPIPHRSSQSARLSSLYTATSHQLSINILHMTVYICGEGNGTPLQYSCLGYPIDGGAWWATVHGVTKSQTRLSNFTFTFHFLHWRRKWQPTPVFLPGESQGQRSLVGCRLWGSTESDMTEVT